MEDKTISIEFKYYDRDLMIQELREVIEFIEGHGSFSVENLLSNVLKEVINEQ